jgi:hypothetical protein
VVVDGRRGDRVRRQPEGGARSRSRRWSST